MSLPTAPKIQAIFEYIYRERDRSGNVYWAFRYTCTLTGNQVVATFCGDDSNLAAAKGLAGLAPSENVYYFVRGMPKRGYSRLVGDWPYAGCPPQQIAEFIRAGLDRQAV